MENYFRTGHKVARKDALKIVILYIIAAGAWITFSDHFILFFVTDLETLTHFQTAKSGFFVLITAVMLYLLVQQRIARILRQDNRLQEILMSMSISTGEALFKGISKHLVEVLNVDHALILELTGKANKTLRILGAHGRVKTLQDYTCQWTGCPCEEVIKSRKQIIYAKGIRASFPDDPILEQLNAESFIGTPMFDASGRMIGLMIILDSTPLNNLQTTKEIISFSSIRAAIELDRIRTQESLKGNEALLAVVFDESIQLMGLTDQNGTVLKINRTAASFIQQDVTPVLNRPFWETSWWTHSAELQSRLKDGIAEAGRGRPIRFEATHPKPNGELIDVDFSIQPVKDEEGNVTILLVEGRDITDRKRAETALRESEERFRSIFNTAAAGMVIIAHGRKIIDANPALQKLLGYSKEELCSMALEEITHPDDRDSTIEHYRELFTEKVSNIHYEKRYLRNDGTTVWGYASVACLLGKTPQKGYCVGLVQDITARKRMEEELQQSNRELNNFADTISHSLRGSLTPIIGFSEYLIENKENLDEETVSHLRTIVRTGKEMADRMGALLKLAKTKPGPPRDKEG